jgi:23S rRNA maturation-related 3'-5' exoribonuclease YhaM
MTHKEKTFEIEAPYFDKNGNEIKEFAVLKIYHFKGVNEQGRGRKHYYMYKWVRLKEHKEKMYWIARHLTNDEPNNYFNLQVVANTETRIIENAEIVQQY